MFTCGLVRSNLALAMLASSCEYETRVVNKIRARAGGRRRGRLPYWSLLFLIFRPLGLLAPGLGNDFLGNVPRNLGVAVETHRVHGTTLGARPQVAHVAEHLRQRNQRILSLIHI